MIDKITIEKDSQGKYSKIWTTKNRVCVIEIKMNYWNHFKTKFPKTILQPGIYVLVGEDEKGIQNLYIGQADPISSRLTKGHSHFCKDWNKTLILIISNSENNNFSQSDLKFLESKIIQDLEDKNSKKDTNTEILNKTSNTNTTVDEWTKTSLLSELEQINIFIKMLGIKIIQDQNIVPKQMSEVDMQIIGNIEDKIYVKMKRRASYANGIYFKSGDKKGKLLVLKGSYWDGEIQSSATASVRESLEKIKESYPVEKDGNGYRFLKNVEFETSSKACNIFIGNKGCYGPGNWIDKETDKTLKDLLDL